MPAKPSGPRLPFSHMIVGLVKQKHDSGPFLRSMDQNVFWEMAENG